MIFHSLAYHLVKIAYCNCLTRVDLFTVKISRLVLVYCWLIQQRKIGLINRNSK